MDIQRLFPLFMGVICFCISCLLVVELKHWKRTNVKGESRQSTGTQRKIATWENFGLSIGRSLGFVGWELLNWIGNLTDSEELKHVVQEGKLFVPTVSLSLFSSLWVIYLFLFAEKTEKTPVWISFICGNSLLIGALTLGGVIGPQLLKKTDSLFPEDVWVKPVLESCWVWALNNVGEYGIFALFYLILVVLYLGGSGIFALFDFLKLFRSHKIQYDKEPTVADYSKCGRNLFFNYICLIFPLGMFSYPLVKFLGLSSATPLPDWRVMGAQILAFFILEDFFHYWGHRVLHFGWFYQNIHKEHHYYSAPFGLAAVYSHPFELLFLAGATFTPPVFYQPHFFTFYTWFLLRQLDAVLHHSGYHFWSPLDLIPGYGGTRFHDYHHKSFIYNYGSRFVWMDKLSGTYKLPNEKEGKAD